MAFLHSGVLCLPVPDSAALGVEIDAHLHYGQSREGKLGGVVLQVDLVHGGLGGLVELQLEEIKGLLCAQYHVHTARGGVDLHVRKIARDKGEDDIEHLLVVAPRRTEHCTPQNATLMDI